MLKFNVFWFFSFKTMIKRKCHVYSIVERVKLYRLVYDSIFSVKQFLTIFEGFFRVSEVDPAYQSNGNSSDRETLDSSMVD